MTFTSRMGVVIAIDTERKTVTVGIDAIDMNGKPSYLHEVPYDANLSNPKVGDKVSVGIESTVAVTP